MPSPTQSASSSGGILSLVTNLLPRQGQRDDELLLVPGSPTDPWFTWLGLVAECAHPYNADWWRIVLQGLDAEPNIPHAQIIKKLVTSNKRPPSSVHLPVFRWLEKCLTFPLDHPLCPLVWQQFFTYYFQRLQPTGVSWAHILVTSQQKKALKERLNELAQYQAAQVKGLRDDIDSNQTDGIDLSAAYQQTLLTKLVFHEQLYQFYHTSILWLWEPRFIRGQLDPNIVPLKYDAARLYQILHGDRTHWMEFVDQEQVKFCLKELSTQWPEKCGTLNFVKNYPSPRTAEDNILYRLESHESPLAPPPLPQLSAPCQDVLEEMFSNPTHLVHSLKLKNLGSFEKQAKKFTSQMDSLSQLDRKYMETVGKEYENERKMVPSRLFCNRGPEFSENGCKGGVNVTIYYLAYKKNIVQCQLLEKNRTDYNVLLVETKKSPPMEVCSAALHLNHVIRSLQDKHRLMINLRNPSLAARYKDMGTAIFYALLEMVDSEELKFYLPLRQFLTGVMTNLGQEYIEGQEDQSPNLLKAILSRPHSGSLVSSLFVPTVNHSTYNYIQLYSLMAENVPKLSSPDTALVLLSKFRLNAWLKQSCPSIQQVSKLLEIIFSILGLSRSGNQNVSTVLVMYRSHLKTLTAHEFPAYYFHILKLIVEGTENKVLTPEIWDDFFTTLGVTPAAIQSLPLLEVCHWLQGFSQRQSLLVDPEVQQTIDYLGGYFSHQKTTMSRRQTLVTKYQDFLGAFSVFFNLLGHVWVGNALTAGSPGSPYTVWTGLQTLFGPWVEPGPENAWLPVQTEDAERFFVMLGDCVNFYVSNSPEPVRTRLLALVWEYYSQVFAKAPPQVQQSCHYMMELVNWHDFIPSSSHFARMAELLKEKGCLSILARIFCQLPWATLILRTPSHEELDCILQLAVGVAWQPIVIEKGLQPILSLLEQWNWTLVSTQSLLAALDSFLTHANCAIILAKSDADIQLFKFLRMVSFVAPEPPPQNFQLPPERNPLEKQKVFMNHVAALVAKCEKEHPTSLEDGTLQNSWGHLLSQVDQTLACNVPNHLAGFQAVQLLHTVLQWLNDRPHLLEATSHWVDTHSNSHLLPSLLRVAGDALNGANQTAQLAEAVLTSYFSVSRGPGTMMELWEPLLVSARWDKSQQWWKDMETYAAQYQCHFVQIALLLMRLQPLRNKPQDLSLAILTMLWLRGIQPTQKNEVKFLVFLDFLLELVVLHKDMGSSDGAQTLLNTLAGHLEALGMDREKSSFFGRLGFGSKSSLSLRLRSLSKSLTLLIRVVLGNQGTSAEPVQQLASLRRDSGLDVHTQAVRALTLAANPNLTLGMVRHFLVELAPPLYPDTEHLQLLGRLRH